HCSRLSGTPITRYMHEPATPARAPAPAPSPLVIGSTGDRLINRYAASAPPTIPQPQQQKLPSDTIGMTEPNPSTSPPNSAGCSFEGLSTMSKSNNRIRTAFDVNRVDEAYALRSLGRHDDRRSACACSKEPHAPQNSTVGHTRSREDQLLPRRKIVRVVDAPRIAYAHLLHSLDHAFRNSAAVFNVFELVLQHEPSEYLPVQALHRRRRQHSFGSAARAHHRVHTRACHRRRDPR